MKSSKEIVGLNALKFICAGLIVLLHFPSCLHEYIYPITRIAVPEFFMISGYFLVSKDTHTYRRKIRKSISKILKLIIIANIAYFIFYSIYGVINGSPYFKTDSIFDYFLYFALTGDVFGSHLWYLTAYIQILILLFAISHIAPPPPVKHNNFVVFLGIIVAICLLTNLLMGSYSQFVFGTNFPLQLHRNALTIALPCVSLGIIIKKTQNYWDRISMRALLVLMLLSLLVLLGEYFIFHRMISKSGDLYLSTIPFAILVFVTCLRNPEPPETLGGKFSVIWLKFAKYGKKHSLSIYLWHYMIGCVVIYVCKKMNYSGIEAFATFIFVLLLSEAYVQFCDWKIICNKVSN